jgi:N-acyl-D-aspartate/D-glutamate deacylase
VKVIGTDSGAHASQLCDACYSTRLLGHWVRERKAITLEAAVWRLTGQPARAFRIAGRGLVREGYFADLVAFDPAPSGRHRSSACTISRAAPIG